MTAPLHERIAAIGAPKILVVGDLVLDRYAWGETSRISPEAPIPVLNLKSEESRPGGAGNVVNVLSHLGAVVSCCGVVGDDALGKMLAGMIDSLCAGAKHLPADPSRPTTSKTRFIGYVQSAGRAMHHILRVDAEDTQPITGVIEDGVVDFLERAIPQQDMIVASDYEKGMLTERVMAELIRVARQAGVPVVADPKHGRPPQFYRGVSLITPNRSETRQLTGVTVQDLASMETAAKRLVPEIAAAALITLDRDGMYMFDGRQPGMHFRTLPREVADITGAGDMVVGAMALLLAAGFSHNDAADVANIAAGIEVGKVGVAPVSREEIIDELLRREGQAPDKVKPEAELLVRLAEHRRAGQRIAFTNGCFDIIHMGHIEVIRQARRQGDILVVGVNSDASVRALKGPERPILGERERAHVLASLADVDYVVIFDEVEVERLVHAVRPDVLVKGGDYATDQVIGGDFVLSYGGRVYTVPVVKGMSTTNIVSRILEVHGNGNSPKEKPRERGRSSTARKRGSQAGPARRRGRRPHHGDGG